MLEYRIHFGLMMFFSLLMRRLPRSTLFPYTTLFRSGRAAGRARRARHGGADHLRRPHALLSRSAAALRGRAGERSEGTRLNSSHTVISYAVFCLKKKEKDDRRSIPFLGPCQHEPQTR